MTSFRAVAAVASSAFLLGCIPFSFTGEGPRPPWYYDVESKRQPASLVAVISPETLQKEYSFRVFITGLRRWKPQTGRMLAQVADVELPQMFESYERRESYAPSSGAGAMALVLDVGDYRFADAHATVTVQARLTDAGGGVLLDKSYTEAGSVQKGKMLDQVTIMSGVRQSSLTAFQAAFRDLRRDIGEALGP